MSFLKEIFFSSFLFLTVNNISIYFAQDDKYYFLVMKYTYYILLLILSLLVNKCYSILKLFDNFNNELSSFYNVDLPKFNNASYVKITGNLLVASFNDKDNSCKISEMPNNVDVLIVPFQRAFKLGCKSYANLLTR
jgi:hypothetical protein